MSELGWHLRVQLSLTPAEAERWDALLQQQDMPTPFMQHAYLAAMRESGSAAPDTGWQPVWLLLQQEGASDWSAACVLHIKAHSYGEYVFDWSWADAYARNGLNYYPKAVIAVPFTPVPGSRLLASDAPARAALLTGVVQWCEAQQLSSMHMLFGSPADMRAAANLNLLQRETLQFHWHHPNASNAGDLDALSGPLQPMGWVDFLAHLQRDKRKKIQQEQRRVKDAGVSYRVLQGRAIASADWDFFYRCYAQTYWEHGNAPYLSRQFFERMQQHMPEAWLMFVAERDGLPIACSLLGLRHDGAGVVQSAYGRYWGALERVDALHFDACYYQPLAWCLGHGVASFEGGAQGEHKMARALLPQVTHSAHWLQHPAFARAVGDAVEHESQHVAMHLESLQSRSPFKN